MIYGYQRIGFFGTGSVTSQAGNAGTGPLPSITSPDNMVDANPRTLTLVKNGFGNSPPLVWDWVDIAMPLLTSPNDVPAPIVVALWNTSLPHGTRIAVTVNPAGVGSPIVKEGEIVVNSEGVASAIIPFDSVPLKTQGVSRVIVHFTVFNAQGSGGTPPIWADETTEFTIGELFVYRTVAITSEPIRSSRRSDNNLNQRDAFGSLRTAPRRNYRTGSFNVHGTLDEALKGPASWARLRTLQDDPNYRVLVIPRGIDDYGTGPDPDIITETALYGQALWGDIVTEDRGVMYAGATLTVEEDPA